jgi:NAD(P)H-dependent FMN reductase
LLILGILGSAAKDSRTRDGLAALGSRARRKGADFEIIDLAVEFRGHHDIDDYDVPIPTGQTAAARHRVSTAEALILATPVYHGSYSGLLKNFLDHLTGDAFAGRAVAILANGGGPRSAGTACDQLRAVVRAISGWSVPTHIATTGSDFCDGEPSAFIAGRMEALVDELLAFGRAQRLDDGMRRHEED